MSNTKRNLMMVLKQEISDLRPDVMQMNQQALLKQLAKQKIIYQLTKKSNQIQLVYAYIALSQYYIAEEFYEPAIKNLLLARQIKQTGDILYLLGLCYYKTKKNSQAIKNLQAALKCEWIQPSVEHQKSSLLEGVSYLQQIYFQKARKFPQKKAIYQQKLINLSYDKIKLTQQLNEAKNELIMSENYYYSLAMADLAQIFSKFGDHEMALSKIKTAISMIHELGYDSKSQSPSIGLQYKNKLIQLYYFQFLTNEKIGSQSDNLKILKEVMSIIKRKYDTKDMDNINGEIPKLSRIQQQIYYQYIKSNLQS